MKFVIGIWIVIWLSVWYVSDIYPVHPSYVLAIGYVAGVFSQVLEREYANA